MRNTIRIDAESLAGFDESANAAAPAWTLTIAFHPNPEWIGAVAQLGSKNASVYAKDSYAKDSENPGSDSSDDAGANDALRVGRSAPEFSLADGSLRSSLGDPHISRLAFRLRPDGDRGDNDGWLIERTSKASLLRVDGQSVDARLALSPARCAAGVTVTLAYRVVVFLRLSTSSDLPALPQSLPSQVLGVSERWRMLMHELKQAAATRRDVLLLGPTGSGKELVAKALHAMRYPEGAPWVPVNVPALPADIAAASLFGVRKGAFTGADKHRSGLFQQAAGGTLFLDEIGDTAESVQPVLLRALQERELQVVGGAPEKVELCVIAATEIDPDTPGSRLRPALRHRLAGHEIRVPALDERKEDIGLLVAAFVCNDGGTEPSTSAGGPQSIWVSPDSSPALISAWARCLESLLLRDWPGNIRELAHTVGQIRADARGLPVLPQRPENCQLGEKPTTYSGSAPAADAVAVDSQPQGRALKRGGSPPDPSRESPEPLSLQQMPDDEFLEHWQRCDFEVAATARALAVSRGAVYRKLRTTAACRLAADVPLGELLAMLDQCRGNLAETAAQLKVSKRGLESRLRLAGIDTPGVDAPSQSL